jgi:hypothetical protein
MIVARRRVALKPPGCRPPFLSMPCCAFDLVTTLVKVDDLNIVRAGKHFAVWLIYDRIHNYMLSIPLILR